MKDNTLVEINRCESNRQIMKAVHPVKTTALYYIADALEAENYEVVKDMIAIAREFGAQNSEIWCVLNSVSRAAMLPDRTRAA